MRKEKEDTKGDRKGRRRGKIMETGQRTKGREWLREEES